MVSIEVEIGYDFREFLVDIKSWVDVINIFFVDVEKLIVLFVEWKWEVIVVFVLSIYGEKEIFEYVEIVCDELLCLLSVI